MTFKFYFHKNWNSIKISQNLKIHFCVFKYILNLFYDTQRHFSVLIHSKILRLNHLLQHSLFIHKVQIKTFCQTYLNQNSETNKHILQLANTQ